jgi:6-pyruvoyl-tetrahydropterin synthase
MKIKFKVTVEYDDDYINDIIDNHKQYAIKTNTACPQIENILANEIEDLIVNYANANEVKINGHIL